MFIRQLSIVWTVDELLRAWGHIFGTWNTMEKCSVLRRKKKLFECILHFYFQQMLAVLLAIVTWLKMILKEWPHSFLIRIAPFSLLLRTTLGKWFKLHSWKDWGAAPSVSPLTSSTRCAPHSPKYQPWSIYTLNVSIRTYVFARTTKES